MDYDLLTLQVKEYLEEEPFYASALSNISALLMDSMENLNWAGFYLLKDGRLTVGPFQGKPACIHIEIGKGVCGTCAALDETQVVPDVHKFPGHIACDSASNSEIVVPVHGRDAQSGGRGSGEDRALIGVLDIDSPLFDRFSEEDRQGLERMVRVIEEKIRW